MATKRLDKWQPADPVNHGRVPLGTQKEQQDRNCSNAMTRRAEIVTFPHEDGRRVPPSATIDAGDRKHVIAELRRLIDVTGLSKDELSSDLGLSRPYVGLILSGKANPGQKVLSALRSYQPTVAKKVAPIKDRVTDVEALLDLLDQQEKRLHSMTLSINHQADNLGKALRLVKEFDRRLMILEAERITEKHDAASAIAPRPWWKFWAVSHD